MRHSAILALTLASLTSFALAAEPAPTPAPDWIAGAWTEAKGDNWTEEFWTPMRGGIMIGAGRSGKGAALTSWEQPRIERGADGVLTYWGSPGGAKPVPFRMASSTATEIQNSAICRYVFAEFPLIGPSAKLPKRGLPCEILFIVVGTDRNRVCFRLLTHHDPVTV